MGNNGSTIFPVHVLGKSYEEKHTDELRRHTESFFRFTYRRGLPELAPSTLTSDGGWGCMLRSAQMLMGHALTRHYLGTEWRIPPNVQASRVRKSRIQALSENETYCEIMRWFTDYPGWPHIYSLHHLVHCGTHRYGKPAGQWVGPSTAAHMLRDLARLHCALHGGSLEVLVTQGDCIYRSEAELVCTRSDAARADHIHALRQQAQQAQPQVKTSVDDNNSTYSSRALSGDWQSTGAVAVDSTKNSALHPLLSPRGEAGTGKGNLTHIYDSEVDGILLDQTTEPTSQDNQHTIHYPTHSNTHHSNPHNPAKESNSSSFDPLQDHKSTVLPPKEEKTEGNGVFFDPLLRPPPKIQAPWSSALLVLVPLMLGIHTVNKEYVEEVKEVLRHQRCVGIIGGSPNHAIYFVGYRGDLLLGLDPHTVFANPPLPPPSARGGGDGLLPAVPLSGGSGVSGGVSGGGRGVKREPTTRLSETSDSGRSHSTTTSSFSPSAPVSTARTPSADSSGKAGQGQGLGLSSSYGAAATNDSFFTMFGAAAFSSHSDCDSGETTFPSAEYLHQVHVSEFVTLDISRLDPSLAIGFYFANRAEFDAFCEETRVNVARKLREGKYPLYNVQDLAPTFMYAGEGEGDGDEEEEESDGRGSFESDALHCESEGAMQDSSGGEDQLEEGERRGERREGEREGEGEMDEEETLQAQQARAARAAAKTASRAARAASAAETARRRAAAAARGNSKSSRRRSSRGHILSDPVSSDPDDEEYVLV